MISSDYIVGLVDGEGSFAVYIKNPDDSKEVKRRARAEPRFYLKLIERDKEVLYELKDFFGCGNVYFQKDTRKNHQNCYRYEVTSRDDLTKIIIPFFKQNTLRLKSKKNDFTLFCELVERVKRDEHLTQSGLRNLLTIKKKMH